MSVPGKKLLLEPPFITYVKDSYLQDNPYLSHTSSPPLPIIYLPAYP